MLFRTPLCRISWLCNSWRRHSNKSSQGHSSYTSCSTKRYNWSTRFSWNGLLLSTFYAKHGQNSRTTLSASMKEHTIHLDQRTTASFWHHQTIAYHHTSTCSSRLHQVIYSPYRCVHQCTWCSTCSAGWWWEWTSNCICSSNHQQAWVQLLNHSPRMLSCILGHQPLPKVSLWKIYSCHRSFCSQMAF